MNDKLSADAGNVIAGKEEERDVDQLSVRARAAKLSQELKKQRIVEIAQRTEEVQQSDECVTDVLQRFGIQI